ncbi:MAG: ferritin [Patescibacteria group bacterium]|jgi:ferritin
MTNATVKAVNNQIKEELYSSYLYLAMSAYAQQLNLAGVANWFFVQAQEELDHAKGFYQHLVACGAKVTLQAIAQPPVEFTGVTKMFQESLKHEQFITSKIHQLCDLASKEKDRALENLLRWYVTEQVEEEANVTALIEKIKLTGDKGAALYWLDKDLAARVYTPAVITAK